MPRSTSSAVRSHCPALEVLRGAMGTRDDGTPVEPECSPDDAAVCRYCHTEVTK